MGGRWQNDRIVAVKRRRMRLRSLDVKLKEDAGRNFQVTSGRDIDAHRDRNLGVCCWNKSVRVRIAFDTVCL